MNKVQLNRLGGRHLGETVRRQKPGLPVQTEYQ
jgi:hypothetical protein